MKKSLRSTCQMTSAASWSDISSFDETDSEWETLPWNSELPLRHQHAEGGPSMALECPSLALTDLHRLYWDSRDPSLRQSIFWKLWGQDASFLRLVEEADTFGTQEDARAEVVNWISKMLWRRGLHWSCHAGSWRNLTATELSHMTLKEVKWHLRRSTWHWFWCHSSPEADLPARDVFVAMAMMRERQQQRMHASLADSPQPDFKPQVRDPASQGCLDLVETWRVGRTARLLARRMAWLRFGWVARLFELFVYLCVAYANHLLLIRGMRPKCRPPSPWSSPAFWVAWVLITLARFCFQWRRRR